MDTTTETAIRFFGEIGLVGTRTYNDEQNAATDRIRAGGRCCEQGARTFCVCTVSHRCPRHGQICIGSHD